MRILPLALALAAAPLLAGVTSPRPTAVVRFDLYDGRVFLPVLVNGKGAGEFQFDSAAGRSCLDRRFARRLRLAAPLQTTVAGAGEDSEAAAAARDVEFDLGGVKFRSGPVPLVDLDRITQGIGRRTDGLVGRELLERYVVAFDYVARTMTLWEPSGFEYEGDGAVLPVEVLMGGPVVRALVRMPERPPLQVRILLDAPHTGPLVLTTPFVDRHGLLESARRLTPKLLPIKIGGVGGDSSLLVGRALTFEIGPYTFQSPVVALSRARAGALAATAIDGLVGAQVIGRFRIVYDYPRGRVILEPGSRLTEPFVHDMSGLGLRAASRALRAIEIVGISDGSPATAADLRVGDRLLSVNGRPVRSSDLPEIRALLRREGTVRLTVMRGTQERVVVLELRPLV
jgi:hypothetical protein